MRDWVIGVDLGATKTALGLIAPDNQIVARERFATCSDQGPNAIVGRIAAAASRLATALPAGESLGALGLCSPGPVDHKMGWLLDPPNLPGLQHAPLRDLLAAELDLPVALEHDAKAAALGEFYYGAGIGQRSMVYVVVGTGVGAAIIIDGQLYRGPHNSAGEVGHITLDLGGGEHCACGSRGCVETFLSGPWIARRYERLCAEEGVPKGTEVTGALVAQRAAAGDASALEVLRGAGRALGVAVASLAMILDVDWYVIGGSVAQAGDLLFASARETVPCCSYGSVGCRISIVQNALDVDGPILGCGWLARRLIAPEDSAASSKRV